MMQDTVKERITQFIKENGLSQLRFENAVGLSRGYVNKLRNCPSHAKLEMIFKAFPELNRNWLLNGAGEMLNNIKENEVTEVAYANFVGIPLVEEYAYAGYLAGYGDDEYINQLRRIPVMATEDEALHLIAFVVHGDSMDDNTGDAIKDKDIIVVREIDPSLIAELERYINKWRFVIVHAEGLLIKQIKRIDRERGEVTIHSLNPLYADKVLKLNDIRKIFRVVKIERNE